jgi:diguanylate cyclase (GGDEF)-like protein
MSLDTNTILALLAFVALLSGAILLVVGYQSKATATAALWATANLFLAVATVLLLQHTGVDIAFLCLGVAVALQWTSIVKFNRRPIPIFWLLGGAAAWALVAYGPTADWRFGAKAAIYLGMISVFIARGTWELWQRTERLPARWPLLGLLLVDFVVVVFSAVAVIPMESLPLQPEGGSFIPVYLVSTVFVIGSAVFLMAMIKERAVAEQTSVANTDGLTGLANRGALFAAGTSAMARTLDHGGPISVVLFDLDKFKSVNDNFGHQTGDVVLRRFAEAAQSMLRPNDLVGRVGGEEFLAIIPSVSEEAAVAIADRIRRAFAEAAEWVDGKPVKATVSAGVAVSFPTGRLETLHDLIDRADRALYSAKGGGRNRIATDGNPSDPGATNIVRLA